MKTVTSKQMAELEAHAYRDGSSEQVFMEEAGMGIGQAVDAFVAKRQLPKLVVLLCGKGNNAGDAYVAGVYLLENDYRVIAYQITPVGMASPLCQKNHERFIAAGGESHEVESKDEIELPSEGVIVDGLFGTGFKGPIREPFASVISLANNSGLPIIAVDIPAGLCGDRGMVEGEVIKATETVFLGLPKMGFFLQDGWNHVGKLRYVDFGLPAKYVEELPPEMIMITADEMKTLLPPIVNNRHKYQAGLVVGLAGSPGMPGAAILSSLASLRGGAGIVRLLHPSGMEAELASTPYELIKVPYLHEDPETVIEALNVAKAVFIGPGLGRDAKARSLLHAVLARLEKPCVIDADALTIIAEDKIALPKGAILTPHVGEMIRLLKLSAPKPATMEFLETCQEYAEQKNVTLILKGGPSFIFQAGKPMVVNPFGDPGMATAGSGDVLTGLLAALLAQGLMPHQAAMLGTCIHGIAGQNAADIKTSYCMIAGDILECFPEGFKFQGVL